jgi:hypothetical protein
LYIEKGDISRSLKYFIRVVSKYGVPETRSFNFIHEITAVIIAKKHAKSVTTIFEFQRQTKGYLQLTVSPWQRQDHLHLESITWESQRYSILKGCYVAPFTYAIFRDYPELISGLLMDTTWRVIRLYVTSILTIVIANTGIPIAVSFGPAEDTAIYETFYSTFRSLFQLDLSQYTIESDQGSALRAICTKYGNRHLACLRHLLVNIGYRPFSFEIGNLVRCRSKIDFKNLKTLYEKKFTSMEVSNPVLLIKMLRKIGLNLKQGKIKIENKERWEEVSMLERVKTGMPTTTNSLESLHGHLNAKTPRRNGFWQSLFRIESAMCTKSTRLWTSVQHNFANEVRKSYTRSVKLDRSTMQQEVRWYHSTQSSCNCGETNHLSVVYRVPMPCSHQYFLGIAKPDVPQSFNLSFHETWQNCVLDLQHLERDAPDETMEHIEYVQNIAYRNIKRFSGSRKKEDIRRYVQQNLVLGEEFALGLPISVHQLISEGIYFFRT